MKNLEFRITLHTFIFLVVCLFLSVEWVKTMAYTNPLCSHLVQTTVVLVSKTPLGACYWRVGKNTLVSEHWFNCGDYVKIDGIHNDIGGKKYNVGDIVPWETTDYSCN